MVYRIAEGVEIFFLFVNENRGAVLGAWIRRSVVRCDLCRYLNPLCGISRRGSPTFWMEELKLKFWVKSSFVQRLFTQSQNQHEDHITNWNRIPVFWQTSFVNDVCTFFLNWLMHILFKRTCWEKSIAIGLKNICILN